LVSRTIRAVTRSKVSHCFFLFMNDDEWLGTPMILAADRGGFNPMTLEQFRLENNIIALYEPKQSLRPGIQKALPLLGERYDYGGLVGDTWVLLGRRLKRHWKNPLHEPNAMFCSAAMVKVMQLDDYPDCLDLNQDTTPEDALEWMDQTGHHLSPELAELSKSQVKAVATP